MTIAIDFDGVIASYDGWKGKPTFPKPVAGVKFALDAIKAAGDIIIVNTCRKEIEAVRNYMDEYLLPYDYINFNPENEKQGLSDRKIVADVYIDDRAIRFSGNWLDTLSEIDNFKPWWRK